jgi:hemerythrin
MSDNEKLINREILKVCEEILPKTAMRNNQQINELLKLVKDYLDEQD